MTYTIVLSSQVPSENFDYFSHIVTYLRSKNNRKMVKKYCHKIKVKYIIENRLELINLLF